MRARSIRPLLTALLLAGSVASRPATTSADYSPDLTASSYAVHVGDSVTLSSPICPMGNTVTGVWMQTVGWPIPKGMPPELPLDMGAISLNQTGSGTSFTITTTEPATMLSFRIDCNGTDSSYTANGYQVRVFPPAGEFWWRYSVYTTQWQGFPGESISFGIASLECDTTLPAYATLTTRTSDTPILELTTSWYSDVAMFDMPLPAELAPDVYVGTVECTAIGGGTISNSDYVYVKYPNGVLPVCGTDPTLPITAALLLLVGSGLLLLSARRGVALPSQQDTP